MCIPHWWNIIFSGFAGVNVSLVSVGWWWWKFYFTKLPLGSGDTFKHVEFVTYCQKTIFFCAGSKTLYFTWLHRFVVFPWKAKRFRVHNQCLRKNIGTWYIYDVSGRGLRLVCKDELFSSVTKSVVIKDMEF